MKVSVIISTYNQPAWLEKTLWGYEEQTNKNFEVVIADDGSGEETRQLIDRFKSESPLDIQHIWHEDNGYAKCEIMNKATVAATGDYLIFTDGDCIPRKDFVQVHIDHAMPNRYLSGGYCKLPMETSKEIAREDVSTQRAFQLDWLRSQGLENKILKNLKLSAKDNIAVLLNKVTPARSSWNGCNSSGWKEDIVRVNGFDERMHYGGQDRELGERLDNLGVVSEQIRYSAICVHLDHARGYKTKESIDKNQALRKVTRQTGSTWTPFGIKKGPKPE